MARFTNPAAAQFAEGAITFHDSRFDRLEVVCPVVDVIREQLIVRAGVFATAVDPADDTKGAVLGYAEYGWSTFADAKALAKALKTATLTAAPVPTRSNGLVEGLLVQFTPADAIKYGVDKTVVAHSTTGEVLNGVMLFTLPAYLQAVGQGGSYLGIAASESSREQAALSATDICEGVIALRSGSVRSLPAKTVRNQNGSTRTMPAITVAAFPEGKVFSEGTAPVAKAAPVDPYAAMQTTVSIVEASAPEPVAASRGRFANFGGTRRNRS